MALITDPDDLNQGNSTTVTDLAFTASAGVATTLTSTANLPALADNEFFEIRGANTPGNDGLYRVNDGSPTTSSVTCDKLTGPNPTNDSSSSTDVLGTTGAASEKSVMVDTTGLAVYLLEQGNLSSDGVTIQALYSFLKEEWKDDATLIPFDFPMIAVTPEQMEFVENWNPEDISGESVRTRKVIRTGGWSEIDDSDVLQKQYSGIITLGSFEDETNDNAYYQLGDDATDTGGAINFTFNGPVNEAILVYDNVTPADTGTGFAITTSNTITRNDGGNWETDGYLVGGQIEISNAEDPANDGTWTLTSVGSGVDGAVTVSGTPLTNNAADTTLTAAVDNRNIVNPRIRVRDGDTNGKTFDASSLTAIGVTAVDNKVFRFPLANATDLKISETDANIDSNSPYTEMQIRYFDAAYNREVDSTTKRDFGGVIDVGTYSMPNGASATSTLFTSASLGDITLSDYTGGELIIHEGTDQGTHTISGTPVDNAGTLEVTLTVALTATESNLSFTLQRSTPVTATAEEIYEFVHRQLRRDTDIDNTTNTVIGRTAGDMLQFIGDTLRTVEVPNPNTGTTDGFFIEGFDSNDTNRLEFTDNGGTIRTFPFVAAGTINFNTNLVNDSAGEYWMFFEYTQRTTVSDLAISSASGATASLDSAGAELPTLAQGDYIKLSGMTNEENNGVWEVTDASPTTSQADVRKYDGQTVVNEGAASRTLDENPLDSPGAIIVDDNSGADIVGAISGSSVSFDFDYDNNTQGGRTAGTDAAIAIKAIGLETAQEAVTTGTITQNTGLSFSVVSGLERNYSNP